MSNAPRVAGIALAVVGAMSGLLGLAGTAYLKAKFSGVRCRDDVTCMDLVVVRAWWMTLSMAGLALAAVGGLIVLADWRRRARRHGRVTS